MNERKTSQKMMDGIRSNNNPKNMKRNSNGIAFRHNGGNNNNSTNNSNGNTTYSPFYVFCVITFVCVFLYDLSLFTNLSTSTSPMNTTDISFSSTASTKLKCIIMNMFRSQTTKRTSQPSVVYIPADIEQYMIDHAGTLGLNETNNDILPNSCDVLMKPDVAPEIYNSIQEYIKGLSDYNSLLLDRRRKTAIPDIRKRLLAGESNADVCSSIDYLQLDKIFGSNTDANDISKDTTQTKVSYSSSMGYMEPLMPPLRHPKFCYPGNFDKYLLRADFIIHDFHSICMSMKPHSKLVLMDLGIDIQTIQLSEMYYHWGFPFDHIYSYVLMEANVDVQKVLRRRSKKLKYAYRPINVEVNADPEDTQLNPFKFVLDNFVEDDIVIVKLDIDQADTELALIQQLVNDTKLQSLVDHFYFEHHVHQKELLGAWGADKVKGSILESLQLFQNLRKVGVTTHYWP